LENSRGLETWKPRSETEKGNIGRGSSELFDFLKWEGTVKAPSLMVDFRLLGQELEKIGWTIDDLWKNNGATA
jgi:hypothetical protein